VTAPNPRPSNRLDAIAERIAGLLIGEGHYDLQLPDKELKPEVAKDNRKVRELRPKVLLAIKNSNKFFAEQDHKFSRRSKSDLAKSARKISKYAAALKAELEDAPDLLTDYLFGPPLARHTVVSKDDLDFLMGHSFAREALFMKQLADLHADCQSSLEPPSASDGPEIDRAKQHCATLAINLMKAFSTKPPVTTPESTFPVVTSLLFEALTGEPDVPIKTACRRALVAERGRIRAQTAKKKAQKEPAT
jgi:hypothetical protein